jgi:hypothetical protein
MALNMVATRPGARVAALIIALARRRGFEQLSDIRLHQQRQVAAELAQTAGDHSQQAGELHQAIALGVPGLVRQIQTQLVRQRLADRPGPVAKRRQRAGGAAKLQAEQPWFDLGQPLPVTADSAEPAGDLHAEGYGCRML